MVCIRMEDQSQGFRVPSASHEFVSVDAVVPAGVGYNGRFAVLAEEDSDEEVMLEEGMQAPSCGISKFSTNRSGSGATHRS